MVLGQIYVSFGNYVNIKINTVPFYRFGTSRRFFLTRLGPFFDRKLTLSVLCLHIRYCKYFVWDIQWTNANIL